LTSERDCGNNRVGNILTNTGECRLNLCSKPISKFSPGDPTTAFYWCAVLYCCKPFSIRLNQGRFNFWRLFKDRLSN
jgi:hypothetical protein